jgi:hypothetical protein
VGHNSGANPTAYSVALRWCFLPMLIAFADITEASAAEFTDAERQALRAVR